jgi:nucleoside-triphosphatase THEP1
LAEKAAREIQELLRPLVETVGLRRAGLVANAKSWPGTELWRVTKENRDELPRRRQVILEPSLA